MKKLILFLLVILAFCSCRNGSEYDGLLLKDQNTGDFYLLQYNIGDTYFIRKRTILICDKDTTYVFR